MQLELDSNFEFEAKVATNLQFVVVVNVTVAVVVRGIRESVWVVKSNFNYLWIIALTKEKVPLECQRCMSNN